MLRKDIIYKLCTEKVITPYQLSKKSDVSVNYCYQLYRGEMKNPSLRITEQLAFALGVKTEDLIR